jgi:hypothetical protein
MRILSLPGRKIWKCAVRISWHCALDADGRWMRCDSASLGGGRIFRPLHLHRKYGRVKWYGHMVTWMGLLPS